jgi:hypothetical protein
MEAYQRKNGKWEIGFSSRERYPRGTFLVKDFNTRSEAEQFIKENPNCLTPGIPICSALKDWQASHPCIDYSEASNANS